MSKPSPWILLATFAMLACGAAFARDRTPGFREQRLELPGMPAAVMPADVTGDGRDDLVVLVAYTTWGEKAEYEAVRFDDIEGLVEVMSIVSALLDRREIRVYPGLEDGLGFAEEFVALEIDTTVQALQAGHPDQPLLAITEEGVAAVRWTDEAEAPRLDLVPLLGAETRSAGGRFFSEVELLHDLDRDGIVDLLLPTADGWSVYRGIPGGFERAPSWSAGGSDLVPPKRREREDPAGEEEEDSDRERRLRAPGPPEVRDVTGDGLPDLVVFHRHAERNPLVFRNRGEASFDQGVEIELPASVARKEEIVYIGDLDGDGRAAVLGREELDRWDDPTVKQEIEQAKRPLFAYRFYRLDSDLTLAADPYLDFEAIGYSFDGGDVDDEDADDDEKVDIRLPGGFQDLDGDGRQDLVTIGLEFSVMKLIVQVLVTQRVSVGMDFQAWCQQRDGSFREVRRMDLSGRFKINLRNVQLRHLSQFAGDFNGDGRADFVQLGRGRKVTFHHGGTGCTYPPEPDRKIKMGRKPEHLGLVRILDLTGEGRSDLYVVHPLADPESGASIPVRLDLYLAEQ
jgi:hypothetical protein